MIVMLMSVESLRCCNVCYDELHFSRWFAFFCIISDWRRSFFQMDLAQHTNSRFLYLNYFIFCIKE